MGAPSSTTAESGTRPVTTLASAGPISVIAGGTCCT